MKVIIVSLVIKFGKLSACSIPILLFKEMTWGVLEKKSWVRTQKTNNYINDDGFDVAILYLPFLHFLQPSR